MAQLTKLAALPCGEDRRPPRLQAAAAAKPGVFLWMAVSSARAALASFPETQLERDLKSLAVWCRRLTSKLSLEPPDGLLLEVRGSLKLFGNLEAIKKKLVDEIERRRLPFNVCTAPTPLGALWLARHRNTDVLDIDDLRRRISGLPLDVTAWPERIRTLLTDMGIGRIGDCLRLPRDGFARRVGRDYLWDLDKVLGKRADPRIECAEPESLSWKVDLPAESTDLLVLRQAIEHMLDRLVTRLRKLQCQARELELSFYHKNASTTVNVLRLAQPTHERERFFRPLSVQLEYKSLPAPVSAVGLTAPAVVAMSVMAPRLFDRDGAPDSDRSAQAALIECLRGRLGTEQVHGLGLMAEHRPEAAWGKKDDPLSGGSSRHGQISPWAHWRPLWILPAPLPLAAGIARFRYRGGLRSVAGPERIQSGWWDGKDISRDYYTAATETGERLWIYRDCLTRAWYLHGVFG